MCIRKKYLHERDLCKVTFTLPSTLSEKAKTANIVGEFNNWDTSLMPMKKRNGKFSLSLELKSNREYQFRYLLDGTDWETDWEADELAATPFADEYNSVVKI